MDRLQACPKYFTFCIALYIQNAVYDYHVNGTLGTYMDELKHFH